VDVFFYTRKELAMLREGEQRIPSGCAISGIFAKDKRNLDRRLFLPLKNNLGNDICGLEYSIEQTDDSSRIVWRKEVTDTLDDVLSFELQGTPERNQILDLLQEQVPETMSTGDIANALGKSVQNISNILKKLKKSGQVDSPVYGQWTVSSVTSLLPFGDEVMKVTPVHQGKPCGIFNLQALF
jgi:DNA-binding transcriptional ArsR family regulator